MKFYSIFKTLNVFNFQYKDFFLKYSKLTILPITAKWGVFTKVSGQTKEHTLVKKGRFLNWLNIYDTNLLHY